MAVAKVYARRIWEGGYEFNNVPEKYKDKVLQVMQADVASGAHTPEEYKECTGMDYPVML